MKLPLGDIFPILFPFHSVNQRLPSDPDVIPCGRPAVVGTENSVAVPLGVILPILLLLCSVNQIFPSGPLIIPDGLLSVVGTEYSVIAFPLHETPPPPEELDADDRILEELELLPPEQGGIGEGVE